MLHKAKNVLTDKVSFTIESNIVSAANKKDLASLENHLKGMNKNELKDLFDEKIFINLDQADENRRQVALNRLLTRIKDRNKKEKFRDLLNNIKESLTDHVYLKYPDYSLSEGKLLMSFPNGQVQNFHDDYILKDENNNNNYNQTPLVFFLGLSCCRLDFLDVEVFIVNKQNQ